MTENPTAGRRDGRAGRVLIGIAVLALGGPLAWDIAHPERPRSEQLPTCAPDAGHPCVFVRADGTRMVRWVTSARGFEESTATEYDEGYLSSEEEPPCSAGTGIGPSSGC